MKDYLESENARNKKHAGLYEKIIRKAFGDCSVMVGHHLAMEFGGDLETENEIPSADTLMFCHEVMTRVFGDMAIGVMTILASTPSEGRDDKLADLLERMTQPQEKEG